MHTGALLEMSDEEFKEFWTDYQKEQAKRKIWQFVQEEVHDCPDCAAKLKVIIEYLPETGKRRSRIEFVSHTV